MVRIIWHTPRRTESTENKRGLYRIVSTCQSWLESLVRKDIERRGATDIEVHDRLVLANGTLETLYDLLIWSRFSNRIYLELAHGMVRDFDAIYDLVAHINWGEYLAEGSQIEIEAASTRSALTHLPSIQSVSEKALRTRYTPRMGHGPILHILILIIDDTMRVLLDVTGDPLHKRWYRLEAGEAPLKESLAAALVAFTNWKYQSPLYDPCTGSGTLLIEAAMIARNMAPGLKRTFKLDLTNLSDPYVRTAREKNAIARSYPSGKYQLHGSDIDPKMLPIARENALRAGVIDDIIWTCEDALSMTYPSDATIITNPPYGKRIGEESDLSELYEQIEKDILSHRGGYISPIDPILRGDWKNKKLQNGNLNCRYWYHLPS